jgi:hypothetical protein
MQRTVLPGGVLAMSDRQKFGSGFGLLLGFHRATHRVVQSLTTSEQIHPVARACFRGALLLGFLGCAGPVLGNALRTMPPAVAVFIGFVIAIRIGRWAWKRWHW